MVGNDYLTEREEKKMMDLVQKKLDQYEEQSFSGCWVDKTKLTSRVLRMVGCNGTTYPYREWVRKSQMVPVVRVDWVDINEVRTTNHQEGLES